MKMTATSDFQSPTKKDFLKNWPPTNKTLSLTDLANPCPQVAIINRSAYLIENKTKQNKQINKSVHTKIHKYKPIFGK